MDVPAVSRASPGHGWQSRTKISNSVRWSSAATQMNNQDSMKKTSAWGTYAASTDRYRNSLGTNEPSLAQINIRSGKLTPLRWAALSKKHRKSHTEKRIKSKCNCHYESAVNRKGTTWRAAQNIFQHLDYIKLRVNLTSGILLPYTVQTVSVILEWLLHWVWNVS